MSFNEGLLVLLLINNEEHHLEIFVGWGEREERERAGSAPQSSVWTTVLI